jgi:hypothetical protein
VYTFLISSIPHPLVKSKLYSVFTKSLRGFEKLWRANKLS